MTKSFVGRVKHLICLRFASLKLAEPLMSGREVDCSRLSAILLSCSASVLFLFGTDDCEDEEKRGEEKKAVSSPNNGFC